MRMTERLRHAVKMSRLADTRIGARLTSHREFVGGLWEEMGRLQFRFLREQGLAPRDVLLDVGCGALRGGRHFIDYLEPGHYVGVDKHRRLIEAGLQKELRPGTEREKRPRFVVTEDFAVPPQEPAPTFALAQSLFSHLDRPDARRCLDGVRRVMAPGGRFYVTFNESAGSDDSGGSHSHRVLSFTAGELADAGRETGWESAYIGEWGHPRGQRMMLFTAA